MLALGTLLLLPGLGGYPLVDPTEARHAAVAREMAREGRVLSPVLYGEPYRDKPSPFYLLLRATERLPLRAETALRLPSVLATLATATLLFAFARRRTGARAAGVGTAIFLASPLVVTLGRFADQDALLACFTTLAVVLLLEALDEPARRLWPAAIAMGLGSWVKGPVAIVLPAAVAAVVAASRRRLPGADLLRRATFAGLAACAIFGAWVLPAWIADRDYVSAFLLQHNVGRFADASTGHAKPAWFYVPALLGAMLPWTLLLPAAIAAPATARPGARRAERELLAWAAAIVGFYSMSRAKSAGYVLPAIGPIALWLGSRLVAIAEQAGGAEVADGSGSERLAGNPGASPGSNESTVDPRAVSRVEGWLRAAMGIQAAIGAVAPLAAWVTLHGEAPSIALPAAGLLMPIALAAPLAARGAWRSPRPLHATALGTGLVATCFFVPAFVGIAPLASELASDRHLAHFAAERAPGLPLVGFRLHPASLAFYSPGPVRKETDVEEVRKLAASGPIVVLAREKDERALEEAGLRLHRWTGRGRHCLFGTTASPPVAGPNPAPGDRPDDPGENQDRGRTSGSHAVSAGSGRHAATGREESPGSDAARSRC